jgi:hypothetical protein
MIDEQLPGINFKTFFLTLDKTWQSGNTNYLMACDPYKEDGEDSFSAVLKYNPKKEFTIRKVKGFNRVVHIGWSYIIEKV